MSDARAPSLSKRFAALIVAGPALASAVVSYIHKSEMRQEVRDAIRSQTAPEMASLRADARVGIAEMRLEQEQNFVKKADLAPITRRLDELQSAQVTQGAQSKAQANRIEELVRALLALQRKKPKHELPGTRLQASDWEFERPSRNF